MGIIKPTVDAAMTTPAQREFLSTLLSSCYPRIQPANLFYAQCKLKTEVQAINQEALSIATAQLKVTLYTFTTQISATLQ